MASRKPKTNEAEIVPDEVIVEAKPVNKGPARKVVETKTVTYEQPIDEAEEIETEDDFDFDDKPKKPKKKTEKELRNALRERLGKSGVLPTSQLRIHVFKFENENDPTSGVQAEKSFCCKFFCNEDGITNGQHLDIAQKYGPGRYFFMVYMNNTIVTSFEERVSAPSFGQVIQNGQPVAMPDPQNPGQVIVQMPAGQPPPPQKTFKQELKEMAETFELMQKLNGNQQQQQNPQQLSPELQMAGFMLQDADLKKKAIKSLFGAGGGEPEKDILATVIENVEPIGKAIQGIIQQIFVNIQEVRGNGTAQMAQAALQNQNLPMENGQQNRHLSSFQMGQEGADSFQQGEGGGLGTIEQYQMPQSVRPEDELFSRVLGFCKRRTPPDIAAGEIAALANTVEENPAAMVPGYGLIRQYPIGSSIWPFIEMFCETPTDQALAYVASTSDAAGEIVNMPHAEAWATQLQAELKKAYEPGGVE